MSVRLAHWQRAFARSLENGSVRPLAPLLKPATFLPRERGVGIYRSNSRGTRVRALEAAYPVCRQVVGQDCFRALARDLVDQSPSPGPDLNAYGGGLPRWCARLVRRRAAFAALPWLPDLARLEWGLHRAWYAPDDGPLDLALLEGHPDPGTLVPVVSQSLSLLQSRWPVDAIWHDHQAGGSPRHRPAGGPVFLAVHRRDGRPVARRLDGKDFVLLRACGAGHTLARISEEHRLGGHELGGLLAAGCLAGLRAGRRDV